MTVEQYRRIREIFEGALDRETHEQGAWIAQQAGDDPVVHEEVVSLLNHHSRAGSFLNHPVVERVSDLLAEDAVLSPGATLGSYIVIKEVGRGGMGRVYLASDTRLGRQVAIKALAPHLTRDPLQRERLRREARAAAGLTHPGICAVYALEEVDEELFIVTEFVEGITLREEIASGRRPSSSEILRTGKEIASALAEAHGRGIVHRDLKPENIMRTRDGRLKILDFGLARIDTGSASRTFVTEPGLLIGTPAYMAPEQLNGRPVDARADVFAFGAVFYEFICGVHPFAAATPLATVARVLESEARPLAQQCPQVPMAIVDCVERCLRKSPEDRYRSAGEIAQALVRAGEAGASPPPVRSAWWRIHQLVVMTIYIVTAALAWQIKEWVKTPMTESIFIGLGVGAAIGGVLRGHLIFTELINRRSLGIERRRAAGALMVVDVLMALALVADATKLTTWPLTAMLTMALGVGIVLAAVVLEPATTRAALGDT